MQGWTGSEGDRRTRQRQGSPAAHRPPARRACAPVAPQRGLQRLARAGQPGIIGGDPAVEGLCHRLHLAADSEIPGPQLAQAGVHVFDEEVHQCLAGDGRLAPRLEPPQDQKSVQGEQLEAPVQRVGHAQIGVELRTARLGHHRGIDRLGFLAGRVGTQPTHVVTLGLVDTSGSRVRSSPRLEDGPGASAQQWLRAGPAGEGIGTR
jgi:hypothetical protein